MRESEQITLYGKLAVVFFSCEKHLVSGVTLRLSFRRSQDDFVTISETAAKIYKVKFDEANLFVDSVICLFVYLDDSVRQRCWSH